MHFLGIVKGIKKKLGTLSYVFVIRSHEKKLYWNRRDFLHIVSSLKYSAPNKTPNKNLFVKTVLGFEDANGKALPRIMPQVSGELKSIIARFEFSDPQGVEERWKTRGRS